MPLETRFDKRLIERNLRKGLITEAALQKHIADLPDASAKAVPLTPPTSSPKPSAPPPKAADYDDEDDEDDE